MPGQNLGMTSQEEEKPPVGLSGEPVQGSPPPPPAPTEVPQPLVEAPPPVPPERLPTAQQSVAVNENPLPAVPLSEAPSGAGGPPPVGEVGGATPAVSPDGAPVEANANPLRTPHEALETQVAGNAGADQPETPVEPPPAVEPAPESALPAETAAPAELSLAGEQAPLTPEELRQKAEECRREQERAKKTSEYLATTFGDLAIAYESLAGSEERIKQQQDGVETSQGGKATAE